MESSKTKLKLFDGFLIKPLGEVNLQVIHGGQTKVLNFEVVSGSNKPILSAATCQKLGFSSWDHKFNPRCETSFLNSPEYLARLSRRIQRIGTHWYQRLCSRHLSNTSAAHLQTYTCSPQEVSESKAGGSRKKRHHRKRNSPNEWISSMVVVAKPKKISICLDHQELNKVIQRPKYQMPTLEKLLPKLCKAKIFSTRDTKDGFYQISVSEASSKLTMFRTPFGRYRYLGMPFGESLAPEECESTLQEKLADLERAEVIRDDIIVIAFGETQQQAVVNHDESLLKLSERARKVNLRLNSRKMELREPEMKFMGQVTSNIKEGLKPDPAKAVEDMPQPSCKQEVLSLLGFVNYLP